MQNSKPGPIRHLVVLGHPAPSSFNHAVVETYYDTVRECGQEAVIRDLYAMGFDPLLKADERPGAGFAPAADVQVELDLLRDSAIITLVYPIWFGMPPAIIKGYVDRVLGAGFVARDIKSALPHPLLHGKHLMQFSSSASTRPWLEQQGQWLSLRQGFDIYLATIFGLRDSEHVHFDAVVEGLKPRFVDEHLAKVREKARSVCALALSERHEAQARTLLHRAPV